MSAGSTLRIAMAQANLVVGDLDGNARRISAMAAEARDRLRARVVVFPELALTGYPPEDLLLRPKFLARVEHWVQRLATELQGITVVLGHPAHRSQGLFNAASVLADGRVVGEYFKQQLPNYSVFDEKRYFSPGERPCVLDLAGVPAGITICEDIWEREPPRRAAEAGARLLINLNASPFHTRKELERRTVLRDRARETGLPIVYVNLVGGQDELVFDGGSMAVDEAGQVAVGCPYFQEGLYAVDLKSDVDGRVRPLPGQRVADLEEQESVYRAVQLGVRDYVLKNGFNGVVLGLSGGIDSALTLAIAVDALGAERVMALLMPSRYTADMSVTDAVEQCRTLGVEHHILSIESAFSSFLEVLAPVFGDRPVDTTEENIQARCRGILLMAVSNKLGRMVLSTSNKSETAVGYSTLYGDMAGGFAPIKDLPKTLVYRLARYRNALGEVIPRRVLERPPSAELRPDQTDQDSLPPYEDLDPILHMYVEQDHSVEDIVAAGYSRQVVERIARLVIANEYKRRQAAPGVRVTPRAFGRDRRYPITSGFRF